MNKSNRKTNIELLRIVSALLILAFHCYGKIEKGFQTTFSGNLILGYLLGFWGLAGVASFMSITAFYSAGTKWLKNIKSIIRISIKTIYYSILLSLLVYIIERQVIYQVFGTNNECLIKKTMTAPYQVEYYWFVTMYIGVLFLLPFLRY